MSPWTPGCVPTCLYHSDVDVKPHVTFMMCLGGCRHKSASRSLRSAALHLRLTCWSNGHRRNSRWDLIIWDIQFEWWLDDVAVGKILAKINWQNIIDIFFRDFIWVQKLSYLKSPHRTFCVVNSVPGKLLESGLQCWHIAQAYRVLCNVWHWTLLHIVVHVWALISCTGNIMLFQVEVCITS